MEKIWLGHGIWCYKGSKQSSWIDTISRDLGGFVIKDVEVNLNFVGSNSSGDPLISA